VILRHKSPNRSYRFWGQTGETVVLGFEVKPRNLRSSSPYAPCRLHTTSLDLSIVRPPSTWPVLDHPWSYAPGLLLLPWSSSLLSMSHPSSAQHETSKRDSPHKIDRGRTTKNFPNSNSNRGKSITHHNQTKVLTTWFLKKTRLFGCLIVFKNQFLKYFADPNWALQGPMKKFPLQYCFFLRGLINFPLIQHYFNSKITRWSLNSFVSYFLNCCHSWSFELCLIIYFIYFLKNYHIFYYALFFH
jgi:hypothetical protein